MNHLPPPLPLPPPRFFRIGGNISDRGIGLLIRPGKPLEITVQLLDPTVESGDRVAALQWARSFGKELRHARSCLDCEVTRADREDHAEASKASRSRSKSG